MSEQQQQPHDSDEAAREQSSQQSSGSEDESPPRRTRPTARVDHARDDDGDEQLEENEGDENDSEEEDDESGAAGAAQIFSHILRAIGGESIPDGVGINRDNIHAILQGLAAQGLLHQDEDGNIILVHDEGNGEDEEEEEEEEDAHSEGASRSDGRGSPVDDPPLDRDALAEYARQSHLSPQPRNVLQSLARMERDPPPRPEEDLSALVAHRIPSICTAVERFEGRAYAGKFSHPSGGGSGAMFACATQDGMVHLYNVDDWRLVKRIEARECGWSLVDLDFSSDGRFVIYSSWSSAVHLANTTGNFELHESLEFHPSSDDDINSVCWLDHNLFATGSDDASIRIWDRRLLSSGGSGDEGEEESRRGYSVATPVGGFIGHVHGLTSVAAHPDGNARYLLSNAKESTAKLWDLRRMHSAATVQHETEHLAQSRGDADYRWQRLSRRDARGAAGRHLRSLDSSLVTLSGGHIVSQTLVRADFSPVHSTGARFCISGSADGSIVVFSLLTGEVVRRIEGHQSIVRDVSWHEHLIVSSSWDHTIRRWSPFKESGLADNSDGSRSSGERRRRRASLTGRREAAMLGLHQQGDDDPLDLAD